MNYAQIAAGIGGAKNREIDPALAPLRFTNTGNASATISFFDLKNAHPNFKIRQQKDANWDNWDYTEISLQPNEFVEICGNNQTSITNFDTDSYSSSRFLLSGSIAASGNIMSLCYDDLTDEQVLVIPDSNFFAGLFVSQQSLLSAPLLPATTLTEGCYMNMFYGCTSLTSAPELPATTLANKCYYNMFYDCTSLTSAPELPATTLVSNCYSGMFSNCSSLTSITCLATNNSATNCTAWWTTNVAASGTFTKAANMSSWTSGTNGIPSGWTVVDAQ